MFKYLRLFLLSLALIFATPIEATDQYNTVQVSDYLSPVEEQVRNAAVKVISQRGHGSGTYVKIEGFDIILTAAHVTQGAIGDSYRVLGVNEQIIGKLIYQNRELDISAILIPEMTTRTNMRFHPLRNIANIGTDITYSGYPSDHNLLTFKGSVAGYANDSLGNVNIILHGFGWFGCSGSGIFDLNGNLVGILWGISSEKHRGAPQAIEDIIWVTPAHEIDKDKIFESACEISLPTPRQCRRFLRR